MNETAGAPFTAWWQHYSKNYQEGQALRVVPARLNRDRATADTGVAVFIGKQVKLVLTEEHAYKLANGITDALEATS